MADGFLGGVVFFVIYGFMITASLSGHHQSSLRSFLLGFYVR
jgi:hypothetical protein